MKLTLSAILIAIAAGYLLRGRLTNLESSGIRLPLLAPTGLALQLAPVPGHVLSMTLLYVSFAVLLAFAAVNLRRTGFVLILLGLAMNFTVIVANSGMPVTRHALVASGQQDTLSSLVHEGGAKHHLATSSDALMPLADAIPVRGVDQVVSAGDVAAYLGIVVLIVSGMRRRRPGAAQDAEPELVPSTMSLEAADVR